FFFQAEDGIRDFHVTGVQTCALPIFAGPPEDDIDWADVSPAGSAKFLARAWRLARDVTSEPGADPASGDAALRSVTHRTLAETRSEERRVGKECRARGWPAE